MTLQRATACGGGGCGRLWACQMVVSRKVGFDLCSRDLGGRKKATRLNLHKRRHLSPVPASAPASLLALPAAKVNSLTVAAFIIAPRPHVQGRKVEVHEMNLPECGRRRSVGFQLG